MNENNTIDLCKLVKCNKQEIINNLKSKIDKVNKIIDKNKDLDEWLHIPAWELQDVLKEDK